MKMNDQPVLYSIDFRDCAAMDRFDAEGIGEAFADAMTEAGATIVEQARHVFPGGGVTWVLILRESHAVLHSWPETGTVNLDIFSCSRRLRSIVAVTQLAIVLGAGHTQVQETARADGHSRAGERPGA